MAATSDELADRHAGHLRQRADQAVPDPHEQERGRRRWRPARRTGRASTASTPTAGTPKNQAPGSFKTNGERCWTDADRDGGDGDEPEDRRPDEQARAVAVDLVGSRSGPTRALKGQRDRTASSQTPGGRGPRRRRADGRRIAATRRCCSVLTVRPIVSVLSRWGCSGAGGPVRSPLRRSALTAASARRIRSDTFVTAL